MSRLSQAVVMLLFGGAIIRATVTDMFLRYVKEGLRPFLLVAGALLVATAIMTIWYELRTATTHQHDDGHGHAHHEPKVGWLLILPVLGLLLIAPPALGAYSAGQAGTVLAAPADSDYPPLPPGDPAPISLLDYASRAVFDGGKSLTGRTVRMSGFVTTGPDGRPMLARIVLTCCAADGRPIKVGLDGDTTVDAAPDSWVQVDGVYSSRIGKDPVNKADVAYVQVKSWQEITEPKQPYD
ncbi:TIGR03943 family putative permease subunit [Actinoplanes sp. NPDC051513]|uniref:TIGR03943 family putative permease subunit n=1 Tax=Actinoplanes sp. NPDC051513 TaxID=3363908 RepID=UPI003798B60B